MTVYRKMYATLTFSWKLSWRLPWHRTKTWFYTECGLALSAYMYAWGTTWAVRIRHSMRGINCHPACHCSVDSAWVTSQNGFHGTFGYNDVMRMALSLQHPNYEVCHNDISIPVTPGTRPLFCQPLSTTAFRTHHLTLAHQNLVFQCVASRAEPGMLALVNIQRSTCCWTLNLPRRWSILF